jgi:hypothetical protein
VKLKRANKRTYSAADRTQQDEQAVLSAFDTMRGAILKAFRSGSIPVNADGTVWIGVEEPPGKALRVRVKFEAVIVTHDFPE